LRALHQKAIEALSSFGVSHQEFEGVVHAFCRARW
jgi:hypothetical protein